MAGTLRHNGGVLDHVRQAGTRQARQGGVVFSRDPLLVARKHDRLPTRRKPIGGPDQQAAI